MDLSGSASGNSRLERTSRVLLSFFFLRLPLLCLSFPSGSTWGAPSVPTVPWDIAAAPLSSPGRRGQLPRAGTALSYHPPPPATEPFPLPLRGRAGEEGSLEPAPSRSAGTSLAFSSSCRPGRGRGQAGSRALLPRASPRPGAGVAGPGERGTGAALPAQPAPSPGPACRPAGHFMGGF